MLPRRTGAGVNRRQRREHERQRRRLDQQIHAMLAAAHADGKPWAIRGLTGACADCDSVASIRGTPGTGMVWADIHHDESCPAYRGVTPWGFAS
jgi:hypothetical protein